jgi:hypothetical protein
MLKNKQIVALIFLVVADTAWAGKPEQHQLDVAAAATALRESSERVGRSPAIRQDGQQTLQAVEPTDAEAPLPTLSQLHDCARRDAMLTMQQEALDIEEAALRAEETRLAARKRAIEVMRSNGSKESVTQAERDWSQASDQLIKKIDDFDHSSAPYRAGVLYQVQHCAFSQVRRQDLQQLCDEGKYPRFCAKYQAYQADE